MALSPRILRKLVHSVLPTSDDVDRFLIDEMPEVAQRLGSGMNQLAKINLLLQLRDSDEILTKLQEAYPKDMIRALSLLNITPTLEAGSKHNQPAVKSINFLKTNDHATAIELLLHNDGEAIFITEALIQCTRADRGRHWAPPPIFTYEVRVGVVTDESGTVASLTGSASEPADSLGRPIQAMLWTCGTGREFVLKFPIYLEVSTSERGLLRLIVRVTGIASSASYPTKAALPDEDFTEIVLTREIGPPILIRTPDTSLLDPFACID